jgi:hypothetical protein
MPPLDPQARAAITADKVKRGELLTAATFRLWAGHSLGALCDGCGEEIERKQIEFEIELPTSALRFHRDCYLAWVQATTPE